MCSVTAAEEGPRGQDAKWRTPTARVRKTGDLQSARARQAEGEEGGWLKTRNREKRPLLHQKGLFHNSLLLYDLVSKIRRKEEVPEITTGISSLKHNKLISAGFPEEALPV